MVCTLGAFNFTLIWEGHIDLGHWFESAYSQGVPASDENTTVSFFKLAAHFSVVHSKCAQAAAGKMLFKLLANVLMLSSYDVSVQPEWVIYAADCQGWLGVPDSAYFYRNIIRLWETL